MDLRKVKTLRSIHDAFFQLRKKKAVEAIKIKELIQLAEISKPTFYLYYKDIYDLQESLQNELIETILSKIKKPEEIIYGYNFVPDYLLNAFEEHREQIDLLFSANNSALLPIRIEQALKAYIFEILPEARDNVRFNVTFTYQIQGGYYVYLTHMKTYGSETVKQYVTETAKALTETVIADAITKHKDSPFLR